MKLVGLMSLEQYKKNVRKIFEKHDVKIYSEMSITGHSSETIKNFGWWAFEDSDLPMYSILFFAIIPNEKADEIMNDVKNLKDECDPQHPPRAFQVDVEKMV